MNNQPLTTGSEIAAYLVAHIIGIVASYVINPMIFAAINAASRPTILPAVAFGMSLVTMTVVLLLFLALRRAIASQ
jgi:hypothetical protein